MQGHEKFVDGVYRLLLRRKPEPEALADAVGRLGDGRVSRARLIHELATSAEFARVCALDDAVARALQARRTDERPRNLAASAGNDERPIEIAWTLARYRGEPRVLDLGYAHAEPLYLAALADAAPETPTGVDLVEAEVAGIDGVQADARKLPFGRGSFDVVFCISTLEHVGKDNSLYGAGEEQDATGIPQALRELKRVLRHGGRVLLTVPTGENEDREWFVQRDPRSWRALFLQAGFAVHEHELYELGDEGWRSVDEVSPTLRYGRVGRAPRPCFVRSYGRGVCTRRLGGALSEAFACDAVKRAPCSRPLNPKGRRLRSGPYAARSSRSSARARRMMLSRSPKR